MRSTQELMILAAGEVPLLVLQASNTRELSLFLRTLFHPMSGYYDIDIARNGSSALKSGVFDYVKIYSSGDFILKGKETRDDVCAGLVSVGSIPIEITGQCVFNPASEPLTIVKFRAANGEKQIFLLHQHVVNTQ
jgi:hypothetical protein